MTKLWVDPPSGWRFGFPKVWSREKDGEMREWMIREGYPRQMMDEHGDLFYTRMWECNDDDISDS